MVPRGDASILFSQSKTIFNLVAYPASTIFPYPPPAVLIFHTLGVGGPSVFSILWYTLMVAGLLLVMRGGTVQERSDIQAAWLQIGVAAMILATSPISWDLRNANSNLVYLGLVVTGYGLLARLPLMAGVLIGLSVSLKLYSGLLLLWLLIIGSKRAAVAVVITILILWVVLPCAMFGIDNTMALYKGWIRQLQIVNDPSVHMKLGAVSGGPPLVTLRRAIVNLTGEQYDSIVTLSILWMLWSTWVAAVLWYLWRAGRTSLGLEAPSHAALADWIVLLLAPLPFSPWLEPYHFVPLFVAAILFLTLTLNGKVMREDRLAALTALTALLLFVAIRIPFDIRGFGLGAQILICVVVLAYLRPGLQKKAECH